MTDDHRLAEARLNVIDIQLHANDKHKQDEAELTEQLQIGQSGQGEKDFISLRPNRSQERWAEEYSRHDFTDYSGLADFPEKPRYEPRHRKNNDDLQQQDTDSVREMVMYRFAERIESTDQSISPPKGHRFVDYIGFQLFPDSGEKPKSDQKEKKHTDIEYR